MKKNVDLIIWLKDGKTMRFEQVENYTDDNDGWIGFVYQGVSTGKKRVATFYEKNIAGIAIDVNGID